MAASHHGDTPYSGKTVTSVPVTPYTTSVDVNPAHQGTSSHAGGRRDSNIDQCGQLRSRLLKRTRDTPAC